MALPSSPTNGEISVLNGITYQFDSAHSKWVIIKSNISVNELEDVFGTPSHDHVLTWDSDNDQWVTSSIQQALGATGLKINTYVATQGQTEFAITNTPIADIIFIRNGVTQDPSSYSRNSKTVTWTNAEQLELDDEINIIYNYGSNVGLSAELNDLTDVEFTTVSLEQNDVLGWDSESQKFKTYSPQTEINDLQAQITELEGEIAQAVSDRIFTDNSLQTQITNNDSDIAASGRFFVQATPPTGGPNSGWVNTTNLKLYVWDTDESVWVQTNIG